MKTVSYVVKDEMGIHARPAGLLVKEVGKYNSSVTLSNGTKEADAKKIMAIMSLGVKKGQSITFKIEGADEADAAAGIEAFLKANL